MQYDHLKLNDGELSLRLEDVASKARVSVSTVSRVVNGFQAVKPSTRKRVMAALAETNYRPNLQARALVAGRSNTIGIIVSNLKNPFFVEIVHYLERQAHAAGHEVLVGNTNYEAGRLSACIDLFLGRRIAGLAIVVSENIAPALKQLEQADIPIALYDAVVPGSRRTTVQFDYGKGMKHLIQHLADLGHRRIAYIGYSLQLGPTDDRRNAFVTAAKKLKIEQRYLFVRERSDFAAGLDATRELLASGFEPSAILCVNDLVAIGVLRELRNRNLAVPGDISVAGFDNTEIAEFSGPSLTTVNIPRERIANVLFRSLFAAGQDTAEEPAVHTIDPELIVRESTGPAVRKLKSKSLEKVGGTKR